MFIDLNFQITVDRQQVTQTYDLSIDINKRLEDFLYSTHPPKDAPAISFLGWPDIRSEDIVRLVDHSEHVRENSYFFNSLIDSWISFTGRTFTTPYNSIEGTDVFLPSDAAEERPAWFRHQLPTGTIGATVSSVSSESSGRSIPISSSSYVISKRGDNPIYHIDLFTDLHNHLESTTSLHPHPNQEIGTYEFYYVDSILEDGSSRRQLLRGDSAFHEAIFRDIDPDTGQLRTDSGAYILNQIGNLYEFTFATSVPKAIRQKVEARIRPVLNPEFGLDDKWSLAVSNGTFNRFYNGLSYRYRINEFVNQDWIPFFPYKLIVNESAEVVASGVIRLLNRKVMYVPAQGMHISLLVKSDTGVVKAALTSDTTKIGNEDHDWVLTDFSHDRNIGLVAVSGPYSILPGDAVFISYHYEEQYLVLNDIELNPQRSLGIENYLHVFYVVPSVNSLFNSVYYLKVDKNNLIVAANQVSGEHTFGFPHAWINMGPTSLDGTQISPTSAIGMKYRDYGGPGYGSDFWVDTYSTEGANNYQYLILAEISFVNPYCDEDVRDIDCRILGGGIRPNLLPEALHSHPSMQYNNLGLGGPNRGIPYPGHYSNVVKVPYTLLKQFGGDYELVDIKERLYRHAAVGSYLLVELGGVIPRICSVVPGLVEGTIGVSWAVESPEYGYNVYVSRDPRGPWDDSNSAGTKVNQYPITFDTYETGQCSEVYTITGLIPGVTYYVAVTAVKL
jgi:hypothetical protein